MTESNETTNKPIKEFKSGSVKAAIWENQNATDDSFRFSVSISRSYRKKDEQEWQTTNSYGLADLANLDLVRTLAQRWILTTISG